VRAVAAYRTTEDLRRPASSGRRSESGASIFGCIARSLNLVSALARNRGRGFAGVFSEVDIVCD
jgi:hypothetical protein